MQNFLSERYLDAEKNVDKSFRPITEQDLDRYFFFLLLFYLWSSKL